jgi:hypothetical protein
MLTSLATFLLVLAVATFYHAPLEAHADPQVTPLHTKAPWYFLWLQGMLKLGDKTIFGVVLPTVIFGVVFVVPWLDRNPHRLASRRKAAIAIGLAMTVIMIILSYMGTPEYGIETPPAQNILSHLVPATEPGPVKELPWDEVETGPPGANGLGTRKTYFVSYPEEWEDDPQYADPALYEFVSELETGEHDEFHEILMEFKAEVESAPRLIPPLSRETPRAVVTVEQIQPNLKWVRMTINWDEIVLDNDTGEPVVGEDGALEIKRDNTQSVAVAVHREAAYGD